MSERDLGNHKTNDINPTPSQHPTSHSPHLNQGLSNLLSLDGMAAEEDQPSIFLFAGAQSTAPKFMHDLEVNRMTAPTSPNTLNQQKGIVNSSSHSKPAYENKSLKDEEETRASVPQKLEQRQVHVRKISVGSAQFIRIADVENRQDEKEGDNLDNVTFNIESSPFKRREKKSRSLFGRSPNKGNDDQSISQLRKEKTGIVGSIASFFQIKRGTSMSSEQAKKRMGPRLSIKQFELINDKTFLSGEMLNQMGAKKKTAKQLPRFKQLLQKHHIVRTDVQADFVKRIIAKVRQKKGGILFQVKGQLKRCQKKLSDFTDICREGMRGLVRPVLPNGRFKYCWDAVSACLFMYEMLFIPFQIGFEFDPEEGHLIFETIKDIFFMIDIVLMFHTAFIHEGTTVLSHAKIAVHYLKNWFAYDFLASLPYTIILSEVGPSLMETNSSLFQPRFMRIIMLLRLFRLVRLKSVFGKLKDDMHSQVITGIISLLKLLGSIIFLAHIVACFWHLVGVMVYDATSVSWLSEFGFLDQSLAERYVASFYWTILTMMTVGYGDITAVTMVERIVNIFVMLLGCGVFGYSMNSIGILLQTINAGVSKKRQKYYIINKFMRRKNLSKQTQGRVQQYLNYLFETQNEGKSEEEAILTMLSDGIQERIRKEINGRVLKENLLFQTVFGNKFLSVLSHHLEEKIYSPGELIYGENDKQFCIFFIASGSVELYHGDNFQKVYTVQKGYHFGELAFFTDKPREFGARSESFSNLFFLKKQKFLEIVDDYPPEKETFHLIKDKLVLYNDFQTLKLTCYSCEKDDHRIGSCPALHYVPNRIQVIEDFIKEGEEFNRTFIRRRRNRYHAVTQSVYTESMAKLYRVNQVEEKHSTMVHKRESQTLLNIAGTSRYEETNSENRSRGREKYRRRTTKLSGEKSLAELEMSSGDYEQLANHSVGPVTNRILMNERDEFNNEFETMMNFQIYFPHNNIKKIIETLNQQQQKRSKMKEIQNQILDLKVGVEKMLVPYNRQLSKKNSFGSNGPYTNLKARSRYWAFIFGDDQIQRANSFKRLVSGNLSASPTRTKSKTKTKQKSQGLYESMKKTISKMARSVSARKRKSYLLGDDS